MFDLNLKCTWSKCPGHFRREVTGKGTIVLTWARDVFYFHSTDCLAFWAASFPVGYVCTVGKEADV